MLTLFPADSKINKYNANKKRMCIRRDKKYSRVGCNFVYVVFTHPPVYRILAESIALYRGILDNLIWKRLEKLDFNNKLRITHSFSSVGLNLSRYARRILQVQICITV